MKKVKYELTPKAYRYLIEHSEDKDKNTILGFLDSLIKSGVLKSWNKINDKKYLIKFN